ncbi:hypothetical protein ACFFWC_17150 [Plantactinospora siamensis]|uniref:Uncharacterized protein n=1 Tax=Plantactinospora siamensis TaxID=555372 RepID=A0ABV6NWA0_9ACTN
MIKTAIFGAGFWTWLIILMVRGGATSGLHFFVASGAIATSLACVVLCARYALQRSAAVRHADLKRLLVDISWNAFAAAGSEQNEATVVPFRSLDIPSRRGHQGEPSDFERRR